MANRVLNWADGRKFGVASYDRASKSAQQKMDHLVGKGKKSGWIKRNGLMVYVVLARVPKGWEALPWTSRKRICLNGVVTCAD